MDMKKIISTVLLALFAVAVVFAQEEPDAVYHQIIKEYTIYEDGSYDLHYFKQLEFKTHFAFNRLYGETFVVYNPEFQKLKINKAYTIMQDGSKSINPKNSFNEVLPARAKDFPDYNHLKEMVITHTGLEVGATVYLDYTLSTDRKMFEGFAVREEIKHASPVKEMKVIVNAPKGYNLEYRMMNLRTAPEITGEGNTKKYVWTFKNVMPNPHEGNICESKQPVLIIRKDMNSFACVDAATMDYVLPIAWTEMVTQMANGKEVYAKIGAAQDFLNETMEENYLHQDCIGSKIRSLNKVVKSNIGTVIERSELLAAMLRVMGHHAEVVIATPVAEPKILWNNFQVYVRVAGEDDNVLLVNVFDKKNHADKLAGSVIYPLVQGQEAKVQEMPEVESEAKMQLEFTLAKDTVFGEGHVTLLGQMLPVMQLKTEAEHANRLIANLPVKDNEMLKLSEEKAEIALVIGGKNTMEPLYDQFIYTVPDFTNGINSWHIRLWDSRITSLQIPFAVNEKVEITIHFDGFICLNDDFKDSFSSRFGEVGVTFSNKGEKVIIKKEISLSQKCYNPIEYDELRNILRLYSQKLLNKLVLKEM